MITYEHRDKYRINKHSQLNDNKYSEMPSEFKVFKVWMLSFI